MADSKTVASEEIKCVKFSSPCWLWRPGLFKPLAVNEDSDDRNLDKILKKFEVYSIPR